MTRSSIVGGDGLYNCHIHTDDIGAAIEAALDAGRPRDIRVTDLSEQVIEERWVREGDAPMLSVEPVDAPPATVSRRGRRWRRGRADLPLARRAPARRGRAVDEPLDGRPRRGRAPTGSSEVVLLPNNKNIRPVAEQVDALVEQTVTVVPTSSIVEGFAALLDYDPDATAAANAEAMRASACNVVAGEVTQAVRDATTDAGDVHEGDWIGLGRLGRALGRRLDRRGEQRALGPTGRDPTTNC